MKEMDLNIKTGSRLINLRDEDGQKIGEFRLEPVGANFVRRAEQAIDIWNEKVVGPEMPNENAGRKVWLDFIEEREKAVYAVFDMMLGYEAHETIFSKCDPMSDTDTGEFFCEAVLGGICDIIEQETKQSVKKREKIAKATAKYIKR